MLGTFRARWSRVAVLAGLAGASAPGCAPLARRFSTRMIEDPITPTDRMLTLDNFQAQSLRVGRGVLEERAGGVITYGVTDRFLYASPLMAGWAVFEQQPLDGRTPNAFSLRVVGGLQGVGYDSLGGWILQPNASAETRWRASRRLWLGAGITNALEVRPEWTNELRWWVLNLRAHLGVQLTDHIAVTMGPFVEGERLRSAPRFEKARAQASLGTESAQRWLRAGGSVTLHVRPWWWLSTYVSASAHQSWYERLDFRPPPPDAAWISPRESGVTVTGAVGLALRF